MQIRKCNKKKICCFYEQAVEGMEKWMGSRDYGEQVAEAMEKWMDIQAMDMRTGSGGCGEKNS